MRWPLPLLALTAAGCLQVDPTGKVFACDELTGADCPGGSGGGSGGPSPVTGWPAFSIDCSNVTWSHTIRAINSSLAGERTLTVDDRIPSHSGSFADLMLTVPGTALGKTIALDATADPKAKLLFIVGNTIYQNASGRSGEVHGTVNMVSFAPESGSARVDFTNATLVGDDSGVSGTFHCVINGSLVVSSFTTTPQGSSCQKDFECGGLYSGKICSFDTFVCVLGCHQQDDCPVGKTCNTTSHTCA
jgi:hypothetical protein